MDGIRRGRIVVECTGLENRRPERVRGFESLPLRQIWYNRGAICDCIQLELRRRTQARVERSNNDSDEALKRVSKRKQRSALRRADVAAQVKRKLKTETVPKICEHPGASW